MSDSDAVNLVLKGYISLSDSEKRKFVEELNKLEGERRPLRKAVLKEGILKRANDVRFGPLGSTCSCCGR